MGETRKILIVDDSPEDRETFRRFLSRDPDHHYEFWEAENGEQGLAFCASLRPDCVLLDYYLHDIDGLDLLSRIGGEIEQHNLAVIMITGTGSETIAVQALKSGALDYLVKGKMTASSLQRAVKHALERVQMQRTLQSQQQDLEEKNRRLELADRRKDEFLAMLAHELRNPLGAISNALQVLRYSDRQHPAWARALHVVERQVQHQVRLVDDLLDVSRITRGKIELRSEPVDLTLLLRNVFEDYRSVMEHAHLALSCELPPGSAWVMGDNARLTQVFGNLLSNAAKFTDPGDRVSVRLQLTGDNEHLAEVTIRDSGIGIDADTMPYIFEPFTQADRTLDRTRGGLGLGLALVKGLVELHGGEVAGSSGGPGQGAEFLVRLPLVHGLEDEGQISYPTEGEATEDEHGLRILIVEDNQDAALTLRDLLELNGHQVRVAYAGPAGVEAARWFCPEVVLCDLGLPGMDGYTVATELRKHPPTANALLVAVSGYGRDDDRRRSRESGFDAHLVKPVEPDELQRLLNTVLQKRDGK